MHIDRSRLIEVFCGAWNLMIRCTSHTQLFTVPVWLQVANKYLFFSAFYNLEMSKWSHYGIKPKDALKLCTCLNRSATSLFATHVECWLGKSSHVQSSLFAATWDSLTKWHISNVIYKVEKTIWNMIYMNVIIR